MDENEARTIVKKGYGQTREEFNDQCLGDCCISKEEKAAILTLVYREEDAS